MNGQCLVRIPEAAKKLSMSKSALYRMVASHRVPSYRVGVKGGGVRVDPSELREALRQVAIRQSHDHEDHAQDPSAA